MTADKPSDLVPKLRFPEFRDAPAWPIERLGRLFQERQETGFSELPLLSVTDRDGVIPQEETNRKNTANSNNAKYLRVVPGDIVYNTMRMWEGRSARVSMEGVVSPAYTVCRPNMETNSYFFAYYFKTRSLIEQFRKYSQGLVKDTLNLKYEAFSFISVGFPPLNEQQKIADFLGSLDDLIAAKDRKLETLRQHKQGLMQQLFPQPGETTPRLRFPEFHDTGKWRLHKFGDFVVKSFYGTSASTSKAGQYPVLRMGNMVDGGLDYSNLAYIDLDFEEFDSFRLKKGDILLNRTNSRDLVGKVSIFDSDAEFITASYIVSFRLDEKRIDPWFCNLLLNTQILQTRIKQLATPSISQANINPSTFKASLNIVIPKLAEQERIADCLGSLDDLIATEDLELEALLQHKQGLMQQLFPSPEAV